MDCGHVQSEETRDFRVLTRHRPLGQHADKAAREALRVAQRSQANCNVEGGPGTSSKVIRTSSWDIEVRCACVHVLRNSPVIGSAKGKDIFIMFADVVTAQLLTSIHSFSRKDRRSEGFQMLLHPRQAPCQCIPHALRPYLTALPDFELAYSLALLQAVND